MALSNPTLVTGYTETLWNTNMASGVAQGAHAAHKTMHLGKLVKDGEHADAWYCADDNKIYILNG